MNSSRMVTWDVRTREISRGRGITILILEEERMNSKRRIILIL